MQIDPTSTGTDCYASVGTLNEAFSNIKAAVDNFDIANYLAPVLALQNSLVEVTTVFSNCGTTTLIT